jgi:hydroxyethylthiazole kinase-like uncharacterized protein yjeF
MQSAQKSGTALELLTLAEMSEADRLAAALGPHDGYGLMRNAGMALLREMLARFPWAEGFDVLCGPGNNGGDGYEVARLLDEAGLAVSLWREGLPRPGSDAARAADRCPVAPRPLGDFMPRPGRVVVDALYGAGLARPLDGDAARAAESCRAAGAAVVSIDLPSGLSGDSGRAAGAVIEAELTVTFFRLKPGHLLEPGRALCGETVIADIGIPQAVLDDILPRTFRNLPALWSATFPRPRRDQHKYSRGHAAVLSGGPSTTGAARLSALAAGRAGAGAVTLWSPGNAMVVNAAHLTSIMLRRADTPTDFDQGFAAKPADAMVIGPGFGLDRPLRETVLHVLEKGLAGTLVLDADALTAFRDAPHALFSAIAASPCHVVLTPHEGEFARLFPDIAGNAASSKPDRARRAAARSGAMVILKGPDTVIAAPDGRAAINENGTPFLATAGSGDVLAGIVAGLCAQKMPAWEAACAAVWIHAEAGARFGPGLIAEDLPGLIPAVLRELLERRTPG